MANYTPPDYNQYLPGEPWTSAKAIAGPENLEAFAEQSPGAPKMAMKAILGSLSSPGSLTLSSLDTYSGIYVRGFYNVVSATGGSFSITLSTNGGSTYAAAQNITAFSGNTNQSGGFHLFVNFLDGTWRAAFENAPSGGGGGGVAGGAFASIADNVTNFRMTLAGSSGFLAVISEPRGGDAAS